MLDQANVEWIGAQRVASRPPENDDEIDAISAEIRAMARDLSRERIAKDKMALSLELLVAISQIKRVVLAIERELSR